MRGVRPQRSLGPVLAAAALLTGTGTGASAQTTTIDEGVLRLEVDGRRIGTETFSIQQRGRGTAITTVARGRIVLDTTDEEITTSLEAEGPALRPSVYQASVRGPRPQRIAGRLVGRRFSARIISPTGERMREYLAGEGAVVVDQGVGHHHYFLARRADAGLTRVPVIIPRESRRAAARITTAPAEQIEIAGRRVRARLLIVDIQGEPVRRVWVDERGRVLRVAVPARDYTAERTALPR